MWEVLPVKKIVTFLMMLGLGFASQGVAAQDLFESQTLGSQSLGEMPPQMMLPEPSENMLDSDSSVLLPEESASTMPVQEPLSLPATSGDDPSPSWSYFTGQDLQMFDCQPALLESTGTWLRRGFWFAEADAVITQRRFNRSGIVLMQEGFVQDPDFAFKNELAVDGDRPGAETAPRLKVGRFLFRDQTNRDHTLEFIAYGGGNWSQEQRLDGNNLLVPFDLRGFNTSFNGAQSSQYEYDSFFNSFELNYHVKQRMLKDRMELEPNGQWVRRAQPSRTFSFLAGLRNFNLNEKLDWGAFGIPDPDDDTETLDGAYNVEVGNYLIGTQMGVSAAYETARWSVGSQVKGGMYVNIAHLESSFSVGDLASGTTDLEADHVAWVGEATMFGKYHVTSNVSLRVGFEIMHVASVALAPDQIDFIPSGSLAVYNGSDPVWIGGSIGFESYW